MTKTLVSWEWKELLRLNKKHFLSFLKGFQWSNFLEGESPTLSIENVLWFLWLWNKLGQFRFFPLNQVQSSRGGILQSVTKYLYQKRCYKSFTHPYPTIKVFLDSRCSVSKALRHFNTAHKGKEKSVKDFCHQFSGNLKKESL